MQQSAVGPLVTSTSDREMMKLSEATDNPNDQGVYWELISRESNGANEFCVGIGQFSPGEVHPPHYHPDAAEFYVLTGGRARLIIGDEVREIGPGTAVYIPRGTRHGISNPYQEPALMVYGFDKPSWTECGNIWVD
jgi:quercetin dioxygenase-like cupin family protein